jgi:hypothetical protein
MWPRPAAYKVLLKEALVGHGGVETDAAGDYIGKHLMGLREGEIPASRDAVVKDMAARTGMDYFAAQSELRKRLGWKQKPWVKRVGGTFHKVHVFTPASGEVATLHTEA